ncbi:MAG TPA: prolyl oligopeptidase family serine peptidase [Candidatus Acidoferrum sp.]
MKIHRIVGRATLVTLGLFLLAVLVLAIIGVPKPPSITARHVPRVSWRSAAQSVGAIRELGEMLGSVGWLSGTSEVVVITGTGPGRKRTLVSMPGEKGRSLREIPPRAESLLGSPDDSHPLVAYLLDEGGSERYRLFSWVPGAQPVALTSNPERLELCCINSSGSLVAFSRNNKEDGLSDLLIVNPRDPSSVRVVASDLKGEAAPTEWSPDGTRLLILQNLSFNTSRAMIFDTSKNEIVRLVPEWGDTVNITGGTWSKDGKKVFLTSDAGADFTRPFEVDLETKTVRPLISDPTHEAIDIHRVQGTDDLIVLFNEDGRTKLYLLDPLQNLRKPLSAPNGDYISMALHPHQPKIVETVRQADGRSSVHVIDLSNHHIEQWAIGEASARAPVPSAENLYYSTFDFVGGKPREIDLIFKKPTSEFPPPWPVIINLHGGPAAQWQPEWDPIDALFQRMGVAILEPNVRGSTGFGKEFTTLDDREKREDAVRDVGALLDWIQTRPDLDGSRVGVFGASYGGYLSLATMVHYSNRLRCGVDLFGISDLGKEVEASSQEHFVDVQRAEYGDERDPKTRAFLDSISPINHVESINVPILIFHGANDVRVKPEQSRKMVAQLEALGRDVRYIEANNEGHGITMPLNQLYLGSAIADFFREFLLSPKTPGSRK